VEVLALKFSNFPDCNQKLSYTFKTHTEHLIIFTSRSINAHKHIHLVQKSLNPLFQKH